ncbi:MAG: hypothetical protein PHV66_04545 [Bacteroidales bacterium]|nr:hypothetical protein [Bacteroidales bacterium]
MATPNSLRSDRGCHGRKSASRYFSGSKVNAEVFSFAHLRRAGSLLRNLLKEESRTIKSSSLESVLPC